VAKKAGTGCVWRQMCVRRHDRSWGAVGDKECGGGYMWCRTCVQHHLGGWGEVLGTRKVDMEGTRPCVWSYPHHRRSGARCGRVVLALVLVVTLALAVVPALIAFVVLTVLYI